MNAQFPGSPQLQRAYELAQEYRTRLTPRRFRTTMTMDVTIFFLHLDGWTATRIARELGLTRATVERRVIPGRREQVNQRALEWWRNHRAEVRSMRAR
jgi:hypothetical protein